MNISFNGISRSLKNHKEILLKALDQVTTQDFQIQGPWNHQLEKKIALKFDRKYAVTVGSGTDALYFALIAAGIKPGDKVLVPALSFVASASCIVRAGATPVFVDIDPHHMMMSQSDLKKKLLHKPKAIILVHLFGLCAPTELIRFIMDTELIVIEDCAQALGARSQCFQVGQIGHISCLSFDPTKILNSISSGGMIITDNQNYAEDIRQHKFHGKNGDHYLSCGVNSQLSELCAYYLLHRFEMLDHIITQRREIAAFYNLRIKTTQNVTIPLSFFDKDHTFQKYVIQTPHRKKMMAYLANKGIQTKPQYLYALPDEPVFKIYNNCDCTNALHASQFNLGLPIYPELNTDELSHICDQINHFAEQADV